MDYAEIIAYLNEDVSKAEKAALESWRSANPMNEREFQQVKRVWEAKLQQVPSSDTEEVWGKLRRRLDVGGEKVGKTPISWFWRLAATAAIALLIIPVVIAALKFYNQQGSLKDVMPKNVFKVSYEFDLFNLSDSAFVKAYLPQSNERQITLIVDSCIYPGLFQSRRGWMSAFGEVVFSLVDAGLLSKQDSDQKSDFADVYDFQEAFETEFIH